MPPNLDQSTLAFIVAAVIYGIAQAASWISKKKLLTFDNSHASPTPEDRLSIIERKLDKALRQTASPARLSAKDRKLRDRAIRTLHRHGWELDEIADLLGCTTRIVKRLIA